MATKAVTVDNFVGDWNYQFPNNQITVEDLKTPNSVMAALFLLFDRLGIDRDAVLKPPHEKNLNENMVYYWDLLPVINMTRVVNHLISVMPEFGTISIIQLLQPTAQNSHSILLFLFNLMVYNEQRLDDIAPYEEELFKFTEMVKALEDEKNNLFEMLNRQAEEKGMRADRIEKMTKEMQPLEDELRQEEEARDREKQELDPIIKENEHINVTVEQKKATKEALLAERDRQKALRVYDAEDIRTQAAQAVQNVREAEEKLNSLQSIIAQKENNLQILQMIKPNLDTARNLLHEISKLKDYEAGDVEDDKDEELEALQSDLMELGAQHAELGARRQHAATARHLAHQRRQAERTHADSELREAEEKNKKRLEFTTRAAQRTQEIKQLTTQYEKEKTKGFDTVKQMKEEYNSAVKAWEEALIKLVTDVKADIGKKISVEDE